jgi:hypothetical protein
MRIHKYVAFASLVGGIGAIRIQNETGGMALSLNATQESFVGGDVASGCHGITQVIPI